MRAPTSSSRCVIQSCARFLLAFRPQPFNPAQDLVARSGVVLFVYPRANTPGCTKQACGFRDQHAAIAAAGYAVYGLSNDNPTPQANWRKKHALPFNLLCDPQRTALAALGMARGGKTLRSHIVIAKGGKIEQLAIGVGPLDSVSQATNAATSAE